MKDAEIKTSIRSLYKIFGDNPQPALQMYTEGTAQLELLAEQNLVLGLTHSNVDAPTGTPSVIIRF